MGAVRCMVRGPQRVIVGSSSIIVMGRAVISDDPVRLVCSTFRRPAT